MQWRFRLYERISITQRQAVLTVLALYFLGAVLVMLIRPTPSGGFFILGRVSTVTILGGGWILYYKRNWEPVRYLAAIVSTLVIGLLLPEPYISQYASMAIVLPIALALILTEPIWVVANAVLMIAILLVRAGGSGIYVEPTTLIFYAMIVGGLLVSRLIAATSLHQLKQVQETVKRSEQQLRALVASLDDIVFEFDAHGTYINVWTANESLLAQPKHELLGRKITEVLGEKYGRQFEDAVQQVIRSGQPENLEYFLDVIGGKHWFDARIT